MSITAANLVARISVDGAESATAKLLGVGNASESAGLKLSQLAIGATVLAGAALVGVGVLFTKMAGDFQSGITTLSTGAGELQSNLKMVSAGILQTAVDTGTSTKDLTDGMFMVESAGFHGAAALKVLQASAEGAKVGMAPLKDVANGVTTEMVDYASANITATQATNNLIDTVSLGKTHMADLSRAMATILPTSSAVGVSLTDTSAAMATMTSEGTAASSAATYLKQLLIALEAPAKKGAAALKEIGLTTADVANEMRVSLPGALEMITEALNKKFPGAADVAESEFKKVTKGTETLDQALANLSAKTSPQYVAALKDIAGGSRQMQGILELTGTHLKTFNDDALNLADTLKKGGSSIIGWNQVQDDFNFKVDRAREAVETFGIKIGTLLLPTIGKLADQVAPLVGTLGKLVDQFVQLVTPIQNTAKAIQPIVEYGKPLFDTFDRASGVIEATTRAAKPLVDTFDRAKSTIKDTTQAAKPFLDTFDRASGIIQSTTQAGNQFGPTLQNIYQGMKNVAQAAGDTVKFIQEMASNIQVSAPVLAGLGAILTAVIVPAMVSFAASVVVATWPFVALGVAVGGLVYLFLQFHPEITSIQDAFQGLAPIIQNTAIALGVFFAPALIKAGVEAVISAGKITYSFIASVIASGFAGWSVVFKIAAYIGALIATGTQAVVNAGKITYNFIASMIASGYQAVVTASVITYNFIASLIASGVQAIIAAGKIAVTFVGSLVSAAGEATISAGIIDASIIPAITGVGVAATIAAGPIILLGSIAVATFALIANRAWDFNRQVQTSTNETVNVAQLRYHQLATGASTDMGNMKTNVTNAANTMKTNVTNSANQTKKDVDTAFTTMAQQTYSNTLTLSDNAVANFQNLNGDLISQMTTIDANIIGYWNDVANYIDKHPINGHVVYTTAGGGIGVQQSATTAHNALGTDYWQGGPTWIGERGPEILNLPRGSQIIPNNKIGSAASSSGPSGQPVQININLAGHRVAQTLLPDIVQAIRDKTGARI